ncbi:MAG: tetrameric acyl-CoA thioesterase [Arenimonas sp.]|jgi:acyl-coenzyme A thioesterase PaaI-like protein|nr:tetrameric acyl-CoA thioesterase [Arenimonas sp.]
MKASRLRLLFRVWPPFLFAGIRVTHVADDFRHARVELRQRWYNRNYVGTHFGGSLFAMVDPFWMILLMRRLGPGYMVWDQAGEIRFEKPGRGTVVAEFRLDDAVVDEVRAAAETGEKVLRWFETPVTDASGEVVARVRKQVYVRRKRT